MSTEDTFRDAEQDALLDTPRDQVATLKDQVRYLQAEGERNDHIIMSLTRRVPDLEPAEPRESSEAPSESEARGDTQALGKRWWKRLFG
jgi:hypothetical protein